jgi:regulator of cell morphogenesis and NO signaling
MEKVLEMKVKAIVADDFRTAAVFEKHGIDFCCNGGKVLSSACTEKQVDPELILQEIRQIEESSAPASFRPTEWHLDALADYIVTVHHSYVNRSLPLILTHLEKVVHAHGQNHPELAPIAEQFKAVAGELSRHMKKEELALFPYIKVLVAGERSGTTQDAPGFGTIQNPIRMMEQEHQSAGESFSFIRAASNGYALPVDACATYTVLYRELEAFERDLHQHIHLENNILFPRAIVLEQKVVKQ